MDEAVSTRFEPIHASLVRNRLLAGAERQAVIYNGAFGFILFMVTESLTGLIAAFVICSIVQGILVMLAKRDPQSLEVMSRSMKYQHFYGTAPTLDALPAEVHVQKQAPIAYLTYAIQSLFKGKKGKK